MPEQKPVQLQVDSDVHYMSGVNLRTSEEEFVFVIQSGNHIRQFVATPKHAKRIMLLLQKVVGEYESKFGELKTELPKIPDQTTLSNDKPFGFGK